MDNSFEESDQSLSDISEQDEYEEESILTLPQNLLDKLQNNDEGK